MAWSGTAAKAHTEREALIERYRRVRADSEALCEPLATEDYVVQTVTEASPPKWHLAHVSWFFETFLLDPFDERYRHFNDQYRYLFNSYYDSVGEQWSRPRRGTLSRPTVAEVYAYRAHVDRAMTALLERVPEGPWPEVAARVALGLNHEQQHQELLLTDIKQNFALNPLYPRYRKLPSARSRPLAGLQWLDYGGGESAIGHDGNGFAFDNEGPRHRVLLSPYRLASRPVSNGEYLQFMEDGGYAEPTLWLSDGWATVKREQWQAPLHWRWIEEEWWEYTLDGLRRLDSAAPVAHVSFYEADAYARWAGKRLPTEQEWESAAASAGVVDGNFREAGFLQPQAAGQGGGLQQLFGDVWEWTASPYAPYPGYRRGSGAFGEYNGKFMCNQLVVRGGSCLTPSDHLRVTYRNFFYPHDRWQCLGLRLAD